MQFEILMDAKENPRKCTILPLKHRSDFNIRYFRGGRTIEPFFAQALLHIDGEDLSKISSRITSLALIDCNWKHVEPTLQRVQRPLPQLVRIPEGFQTAYPRRNKMGNDPEAGLATIEALFIASAFLGFWDETLFEKYYFKEDFLEKNKALWKHYKIKP